MASVIPKTRTVALVGPGDPELTTSARELTHIAIVETTETVRGNGTSASFGVPKSADLPSYASVASTGLLACKP